MTFQNAYTNQRRAQAYDELAWGGTYLLALKSLKENVERFTRGRRALDFGCGTGRSSRLLQTLGFSTVGLDISAEMVRIARERDPAGDYRLIEDGDFNSLANDRFDLILAAFPFDNIPNREHKVCLFRDLGQLLQNNGNLIVIVSTPEIYTHEWLTFTTQDFPENRQACRGDTVRIITRDYSDGRPVEDILWPDRDYQAVFRDSGLKPIYTEAPLATGKEGLDWQSETRIAPWRTYVLATAKP